MWDFGRVIGDASAISFIRDDQAPMTQSRFFPHASLNVAENLLRGDGDRVAVIEADESGHFRTFTLGELRRLVASTAQGLRAAGVISGDSVGGILPNRVEGLVALLATLSIGAVWSSCSPDFGAAAIVDRLGQIGVKVLFAAPRYRYAGKQHDISDRLAEIVAAMPTVTMLVLTGEASAKPNCAAACLAFDDFGSDGALTFERVPFDHPAYVLYTSGTTGAPKAIVHRTGGVLLQHLKEHLLHGDVRPGDVMSWYTNTAWMMYHWLISGLACGAAVVLYDGAPILKTADGLDPSPLWAMAQRARVTHFGTSPKYLATLAGEGYAPGRLHDLSALRSLLSAGAPVSPGQFDWVYAHVKHDMIFASISGSTRSE